MVRLSVLWFLAFYVGLAAAQEKQEVKIGAIFDRRNSIEEVAFRSAATRITLFSKNYNVTPVVHYSVDSDSYVLSQIVCQMIEEGVAAIFSPYPQQGDEVLRSAATSFQIPYFQTFWNKNMGKINSGDVYIFNLHPEEAFTKALATLARESNWKTYTIMYENADSLTRLQDVLKARSHADLPVTVRKLENTRDHRSLLKEIKATAQFQILIDCEADRILDILTQAAEVNITGEYYNFILTSLDAHTLEFGELKYRHSNITTFRMLELNGSGIDDAVRDWLPNKQGKIISLPPQSVKTGTALLYDAVNIFMTAYVHLDMEEEIFLRPLSCSYKEFSSHGAKISHYLRNDTFYSGILPGPLTGRIAFNSLGQRTDFELKLVELGTKGFRETGSWNSNFPKLINSTFSKQDYESKISKQIQRKVFRVTSRIGDPYLMYKKGMEGEQLTGNDRFEGYSLDLIDGIAEILNFSYRFDIVPDQSYGSYDPKTKQWNGLIQQLLERKADLAVCDLTITYERRRAVDFTIPFMTLGISILYSKAVKEPPELFSFMHPLSLDVWLYMATAYLLVTMIVFLVARLSKGDWENPHPCNSEPEELENIWDLKNCFWLNLGSIMNQGCDILPKGISTRMVTSMWWFFSLIMTASYTANLAAFLTMERMGPTIESAEDLAKQTKIKYGAVRGGATSSFFEHSNDSIYHRMWTQMVNAEPSVFEKSNKDGVKRVTTSKRMYAFLMESSSIEYEMERDCDLIQVGRWLDTKGYGIAMPFNSPYRTKINQAILKMQESGKLHHLKQKWWKEKYGGGKCKSDTSSTEEETTELSLSHVGGVFVVLFGGVILALIISIAEFFWNVRKLAVHKGLSLKEAFDIELRFVLNISVRKKAAEPAVAVVSENEMKSV